jgi:RHS repeat-associated protein
LLHRNNSITERSLLEMVSEHDHDGTPKLPLTFNYAPGSYAFDHIDGGHAGVDDDAALITGDFDGDGRGDLLHQGEDGWVTQRGVVNGFAAPVAAGIPGLYAGDAPRPVDVDADGRIDMAAPVHENVDDALGYQWRLFQWNGTRFAATTDLDIAKRGFGHDTADPVYFADFDGNGLPDFSSATLTADDEFEPWYFRLNTGATGADRFADKVATTRTPSSELLGSNNFVLDSDGDGRSELVSMTRPVPPIDPPLTQPGWTGWGLFAGTNEGVEGRSLNVWGHSIRTHFGDVNGDGLDDAVYPYYRRDPGGQVALQVQLNSGDGFGSRHTTTPPAGYVPPDPISGLEPDKGVRIADFNNDGRDDVLVFHEGTPTGPDDTSRGLQLFVWNDNRLERADLSQGIGNDAIVGWSNAQPLDWDGDGVLDIVHVDSGGNLSVYRRLGGVPDKLAGVGDTLYRDRVEVEYSTLGDRTDHVPGTCSYPQSCPTVGDSIVKRHRLTSDFSAPGEFTFDTYNHSYTAAREDLHGRGWLGFAEHRVFRTRTSATSVTEFDNVTRDAATRTYPFAHVPKRTTYTARDFDNTNGREFQSIVATTASVRQHTGGTHSVEVRSVTTTEQERPVGATAWQQLRTNTTQSTFDDFGNIDTAESVTAGGRTLSVDLEHRNDTGTWLIGLPTRKVTTGCTADARCAIRETTYDYDASGNHSNHTLTMIQPNTASLKLTTTRGYDQFGNVTSVSRSANTGPARVDTMEYAGADKVYPSATVNALGHRTEVQVHPGLGVPLSTTDPNGVKTTRKYDWFGRLRETNRSDGSFERIGHAYFVWQFTTTTSSGGGSTTSVADQLGRERERAVRTFDGRTATTYTNYDFLGRGVWQTSRPTLPGETAQYTTTLYDNRGRVRSVTAPDGAQERRTYLNREVHSFDAKGVESYTVDTVDGDVGSSYEDDPDATAWLHSRFEYGPFGEVTRMVAPDDTAQVMEYDALGRRVKLVDPNSGTSTTGYNAFGEVISLADGTARTTTLTRDLLGRVKQETSPDGVTTNVWDTATGGTGLLARTTSADGIVTSYTYDLGRPDTTTWTVDGTAYEIGREYDDVGRLAGIEYPAIPGATGRLRVDHTYNQHGYLSQVTDAADGTAYWSAVARNGAGQLTEERYGNGVATTRSYHAATGLLTAITTSGPGTTGTLGLLSYAYDLNRNVTGKGDWVNGRGETYGYDELNRITSWSATAGQLEVNAAYTYDKVGNLKSETVTGIPNQNVTYGHGERGEPPHALTSRNSQHYEYDEAGREISGPQRTIEYNRMGLPSVINWGIGQGQGKTTDFAYDGSGSRVRKRDGDQTVLTIGGLFERRLPAGTGGSEIHNLHNIVVEGRVVAQINRAQAASGGPITTVRSSYLHTDRQGSTVLVTNRLGRPVGEDDSWLRQLYYDPFGRRIDAGFEPLGANKRGGPRQGYTSQIHDDEFGLIDMVGRIYDPRARRFTGPDPFIHDRLSSQQHNRYAYVQNNPVTLTDPTGFRSAGSGGSTDDDSAGIDVDCTDCTIVVTPVDVDTGPDLLGAMLLEFAFMSMRFHARAEAEMRSWMYGDSRGHSRVGAGPDAPPDGAMAGGRDKRGKDAQDRSRQSKPRDTPRGTRPIDQSGLGREDVHKIKDRIGAEPTDWVGITPDGHVVTADEDGNVIDHGDVGDYVPRVIEVESRSRAENAGWGALIGAGLGAVLGGIGGGVGGAAAGTLALPGGGTVGGGVAGATAGASWGAGVGAAAGAAVGSFVGWLWPFD